MAAQDGCAAEVHLPRPQHNRFMEGNAMKFIVLSEKNTEQNGFPRNLHFLPPFSRNGVFALARYFTTSTGQEAN